MEVSINKSIYVELTSLLDYRYALLKTIDSELAINWIKNDKYHNRLSDSFDYITVELFYSILKNNYLHQLARLTEITKIIDSEIMLKISKHIEAGDTVIPTIKVNIYPFKFNDKIKEKIKASVSKNIRLDCNVEIIEHDIYDIDPNYWLSNYDVIIKYFGLNWLDKFIKHVKQPTGNVDTILYTPALYSKNVKIKKLEKIDEHFGSLEELYLPYIKLKFLPSGMFSIKKSFI